MIRVLLVDDQILVRAGLAALIRASPGFEVAGEASNGDEALALSTETAPHVILMVIHVPSTNGWVTIQRVLDDAAHAAPRILVLTTLELAEYAFRALTAGASGFLLEDTPPERLLQAIRTIADGETVLAPPIIRRLIGAYLNNDTSSRAGDAALGGLTGRELEVLQLVARGLSNIEIAERLALAEATVKTHLNRTMAKLHLASRAQAVRFAYESGLVRPGSHARQTGAGARQQNPSPSTDPALSSVVHAPP